MLRLCVNVKLNKKARLKRLIQLCTEVAGKWCCTVDSMFQHKLKTAVHFRTRLLSPKEICMSDSFIV